MSADRVGIEWLERVEASRSEERAALESILVEHLKEQKRLRWGKNAFRLFIALYLLAVLWVGTVDLWRNVDLQSVHHRKHTAVVEIRGPIQANTNNSADNIIKGLNKAFEDVNTAGVVLRINSPGGSPVQSGQVYDEMMRLRQKFPKMPFYAALEDLCASGGYYIAAAAPFIYADKATLVGSIGVILQGFGFQETLNKLGVESRQLTAGKNKAFLSPFGPLDEAAKGHAQTLLDTIHKQFVEAVRKGRGERLRTWKAELFAGLIWTGEEAVELGLVDGLGSVAWLAREQIKETRMVDFTQKNDWLSRVSKEMGIP
ncbi:MAG: S49 family peptidase [Magnetococcales bacterium]|nr:S49 family peptidase [Magnetococcales bacterium]